MEKTFVSAMCDFRVVSPVRVTHLEMRDAHGGHDPEIALRREKSYSKVESHHMDVNQSRNGI